MKPFHPIEDWELSAYAAQDLDSADQLRVRQHLPACPACRERLAEFALLGSALHSLPELEPSRDLWAGIAAGSSLPASATSECSSPQAFPDTLWSEWLDRELDPDAVQTLRVHASTCVACSARLGELELLVQELRSLPALEPSPFLWTRIRSVLDRKRARRVPAWVPGWAAAAAAVAGLVWWSSNGVITHPDSGSGPLARQESLTPSTQASLQLPLRLPVRGEYSPSLGGLRFPGLSPVRPMPEPRVSPAVSAGGASAQDAGDSGAGPDPDPRLSAEIRTHLDELDGQIRDTQMNLALNPGNQRVQAAAWAAYMAKVEYLRTLYGSPQAGRNRTSGTRTSWLPLPPSGREVSHDRAA